MPVPIGHLFTPSLDVENRIVLAKINDLTIASIYVPNGGKDFPAKLCFLEALESYAVLSRHQARRCCSAGI
jgi:exodeoxyribonuclease-3